ncbi:MAG: two-component regulator propeller domain-containing protein [Desulfatirhabdiaceae bacterium]
MAITFFDNAAWVGSKTGLHRLDIFNGAYVDKVSLGPEVSHIRTIVTHAGATLWIGHVNGLTRFQDGNAVTFTKTDGLPDNRVNVLSIDRSGRLWIGTSNGLAFIDDGQIVYAPENSNLLSPIVNTVVEDFSGGIWIGSISTPTGGITILNKNLCEVFTPNRGLPHPYVNQLLVDRQGSVWAATGQFEKGGVCQFRKGENGWELVAIISQADGLPGAKVRSMFQDTDGDFWFGFENDGLSLLNAQGIRTFDESDGLPHKEITCIVGGPLGEIWLGTLAGVVRIDPLAVKRMKQKKPKILTNRTPAL